MKGWSLLLSRLTGDASTPGSPRASALRPQNTCVRGTDISTPGVPDQPIPGGS